jgi:hypothetical protein
MHADLDGNGIRITIMIQRRRPDPPKPSAKKMSPPPGVESAPPGASATETINPNLNLWLSYMLCIALVLRYRPWGL